MMSRYKRRRTFPAADCLISTTAAWPGKSSRRRAIKPVAVGGRNARAVLVELGLRLALSGSMIARQARDSSATRTNAGADALTPPMPSAICSPLPPPRKPVAVASAVQRPINTGDINSFAAGRHPHRLRAMYFVQRKTGDRISLIDGGVQRHGQYGRRHV